jgi:hypothetical protein
MGKKEIAKRFVSLPEDIILKKRVALKKRTTKKKTKKDNFRIN